MFLVFSLSFNSNHEKNLILCLPNPGDSSGRLRGRELILIIPARRKSLMAPNIIPIVIDIGQIRLQMRDHSAVLRIHYMPVWSLGF
jgi:hypothetical protein